LFVRCMFLSVECNFIIFQIANLSAHTSAAFASRTVIALALRTRQKK
jgi:hypothetical protein